MHAGIVGAGIMGRLLAWQLLLRGWQVSLFDERPQDDEGSCSFVAAGMLSPYIEVETSTNLLYQLGSRSIMLWKTLLAQLSPEVPSVFFQQSGSLLYAHRQDQSELQRLVAVLRQRWPENNTVTSLDSTALQQLEPELATIDGASYYLQHEAQIAPHDILSALQQEILQRGGQWYDKHCVTQLTSGCISTASADWHFDCVFDCRGLGARAQLPRLRGLRGEIIVVHAPEVNITRPVRLVHPRNRLYIAPRPNQMYYIGASELESEDYSPISVRTCLELLTAAYSLHRGFSEARIVRTMTQCRPAFCDHLPQIGIAPRLFSINGLYRHGYLLAPALAEIVINRLEQGKTADQFLQLLADYPVTQ